MSTTRPYVLHCDAPGCTATFCANLEIAWPTRDEAKKVGWTVHVVPAEKRIGPAKSEDRCPDHPIAEAA